MPYICFSSITLNSGKTTPTKKNEMNKSDQRNMEYADPGSKSHHTSTSISTLESIGGTPNITSESIVTELALDWYIGGALSVDATWLSIHQPPVIPPSQHSSESNHGLHADGANWSYLLEALDVPKLIPHAPSNLKGDGIYRSRVTHRNSDQAVAAASLNRQSNPDIDHTNIRDIRSTPVVSGGVQHSSSSSSSSSRGVLRRGDGATRRGGGVGGDDRRRDRSQGGGGGSGGDRRKVSDVTFPIAVSYAQTGRGRWAEGGNPHHPQLYSATITLSSTPLTSSLSDSTLSSRSQGPTSTSTSSTTSTSTPFSTSNSTVRSLDFNMPPIYIPPGIYWLVSWTEVDRSWGDANQGEGSSTPESYLSNARTNTDWISKQNEQQKGNADFRLRSYGKSLNEKIGIREEYVRVKPRLIKGRKLWPSDPLILEIHPNGKVSIISSVLKCAWWSRTKEDPTPTFSNTTSTTTSPSTADATSAVTPSSQGTKENSNRSSKPSSNTQNTDFNFHDFVLRSKHRTAFWMVAISIILFIIRYLVHFFGCCIRDFSLCGGSRRRDNAVYQRIRTTVT